MSRPLFTVVIPTIGRPSLTQTLDSIRPGVEVIVVADTFEMGKHDVNAIRLTVADWGAEFFTLDAGRHDTGSPQLALGYREATGQWILNCGDDDVFEPRAFDTIDCAIGEVDQDIPLFFRTVLHPAPHRGNELPIVLWHKPEIVRGLITGQCFVTPNVPEKLGEWVDDVTFMQQTVDKFGGCAWRTEVISQCY